MIEDEFGTYTGSIISNLPNGKGIKKYKTGHIIEGYWTQGRPVGKVSLICPPHNLSVTFKNGKINRIHTDKTKLSIQFPYKFIQKDHKFQEIFDESNESWFSILRLSRNYDFFEKAFNRKLGMVKRFDSSGYWEGFKYFGEIESTLCKDKIEGYGILYNENTIYAGNFSNGFLRGNIHHVTNHKVLKGSHRYLAINGLGTEKNLMYGIKFKGNFIDDKKHGKFNISFKEFRIEATYYKNTLKNPVRYFKNEKFIAECEASEDLLIPKDYSAYPDLVNYTNLANEMISKQAQNIKSDTSHIDQRIRRKYSKLKSFYLLIKIREKYGIYSNNWTECESILNSMMLDAFYYRLQGKSFESSYQRSYFGSQNEKMIFNGIGEQKYQGNCRYIGSIKEGMRDGLGVFFRDGKVLFKGYWKKNLFHGKGVIFDQNFKIQGVWNMGKIEAPIKFLTF